jgi:transposase
VLWIGRTGSPWRDLPTQFGRWHTVYMRFSRWRRSGVWQHIALEVSGVLVQIAPSVRISRFD